MEPGTQIQTPQIQVIKIGTKCLFAGNGNPNYELFRRRAREIQDIDMDERIKTMLVVSGAIAMGKMVCGEARPNDALTPVELQRYACVGQPELMRFYANAFEGIYNVSQLLVTNRELDREENVRNRIIDDAWNSIVTLINYNDGVDFEEIMKDNDTLAATIVKYIRAKRLIVLGVDYDGMKDSEGKIIQRIGEVNRDLYGMCNGSSAGGRGGFGTKLDAARDAMDLGIEVIISNINYNLKDIVAGKVPRTVFSKL